MKIGIITFHRALNYGAFLQAFALKNYLHAQGHDVDFIDYWPDRHKRLYRLIQCRSRHFYMKPVQIITSLISYSRALRKQKKMEKLFFQYFHLDKHIAYQYAEDLQSVSVDAVVYGSDQIWSKSVLGYPEHFDPAYWGAYISSDIRKIAYAPSMGVINLTKNDKIQIRQLLHNMNFLSVRETSLKEILQEETTKEIQVVCDPVFLLDKSIWESFCTKVRSEKYILYYNLMPSKEANHFVRELQKLWKINVIEITGYIHALRFKPHLIQTADPFELISLIKHADIVVSTSFHGVAFSLIFEKQFYALGMGNNSSRVGSLLGQLQLQDRMNGQINVEAIHYEQLRPKLTEMIKHSTDYLRQALS